MTSTAKAIKGTRASEGPATGSHARSGDLRSAWDAAYRRTVSGEQVVLDAADLAAAWGDRFSSSEMHEVVIPKRTLSRRLRNKEPLSAEETDRALRLARISTEAERVFGDPERSGRWLREPNPAFSGRTPLELLRTETGAKAVEELLGQIDHGMFI